MAKKPNGMKNELENIRSEIETVYAIELLEYRDKNHLNLGGDSKSLSESKQDMLSYSIGKIKELLKSLGD
jgi:hypothetical protein